MGTTLSAIISIADLSLYNSYLFLHLFCVFRDILEWFAQQRGMMNRQTNAISSLLDLRSMFSAGR